MPAPVNTVVSLTLAAAPLLTLLLAAWVVGRGVEQAAPSVGLSRVAIADLTIALVMTTVVSARVLAIVPTWRGVITNPLDLLRFTGSGQLSPLGGALGAALGLLIFTRRRALPLLRTADLYGLMLPLGIAVHSGGCLLRGDCYGAVAPAPFGIVFPGFELPRYPVGLYAAALALFAYAGLAWFAQRKPPPGAVSIAALASLAVMYAGLAPLGSAGAPGVFEGPAAFFIAIALTGTLIVQIGWLVSLRRPATFASSEDAASRRPG